MQDNLRQKVKLVKAMHNDIYKYTDIADMLDININSFYNWLSGAYNLGEQKAKQLEIWINDILF